MKATIKRKRLKVRVGVILIREGKVLLARQHVPQGQSFWIIPGGRMKRKEGLFDCARREIAEETGLQIEPIRLLYIGDFFKGDQHVVDTFWLGEISGGELRKRGGEIDDLEFFDVPRLAGLPVQPTSMAEYLIRDLEHGFPSPTAYLGKYRKEVTPVQEEDESD
jgi:ADP-ribose pyrophosphatase YjhB (NUDIX family)